MESSLGHVSSLKYSQDVWISGYPPHMHHRYHISFDFLVLKESILALVDTRGGGKEHRLSFRVGNR